MTFLHRFSTNQQNFTLRVPDSVTTWQADAISLNPQSGIGVSNPTRLQSVKNFFMDFNLPYSVIRGEAVEIPLTTYNYLNVCVEVILVVSAIFLNFHESEYQYHIDNFSKRFNKFSSTSCLDS